MKHFVPAFFIMLCFCFCTAKAQNTGFINRQATSVAGRAVLDPNGDGYTSATTGGFGAPNDIVTSEIAYKPFRAFSTEPSADLRKGSRHNFTEFVPDAIGSGVYAFVTGSNLMLRFRIGSISTGAKGYSFLLDTDNKIGSTGCGGDPNVVLGNPGFEVEIILETNSRLAIYNIDGTATPTLVTAYNNWQDMSQVSIAGTSDNGDADFFLDFFVPLSALNAAPINILNTTSLKMGAATVINPSSAITNEPTDIFGLNDLNYPNYEDQYKAYWNLQASFTLNDFSSGGSGASALITTNSPIANSPITAGTVTISGTWVKAIQSTQNTTTITVFKNNVLIGTINNVATGTTWALANIMVANGDVISAKAQSTTETISNVGNCVLVVSCTPTSITPNTGFSFSCNNRRGMSGTRSAGAAVKLYTINAAGLPVLFATDGTPTSPSGFNITYSSATTWEYNGANNSGQTDPCSGGPSDIPDGSYAFTLTGAGLCESGLVLGGCVNLTATATPTITQATLTTANTIISGTAVTGASVRLLINGFIVATQTAVGGNYSFSGLALQSGAVVQVIAQAMGQCASTAVVRTVTCLTLAPKINADVNNQIPTGNAITGSSNEPLGTTIRIYSNPGAVLVATTTVTTGGVFSTVSIPYNAVAGTSYYATAQNGSCTVSNNSNTVTAAAATSALRCGNITGPVTAGTTTVSGTLASAVSNTTVKLYADGLLIGSILTNTTSFTISGIAASAIYVGAELSIGIQEGGSREVFCPNTIIATCGTVPATPIFTPTSATIVANQSVTFTITNAVAGNYYAISDITTGQALATGVFAASNGNLNIISNTFTNSGTYNFQIVCSNISGLTVCRSLAGTGTVTVGNVVNTKLLSFTANRFQNTNTLTWEVSTNFNVESYSIEKSTDGILFLPIGNIAAAPSKFKYSFAEINVTTNCYYRIAIKNNLGKSYLSSTVFVSNSNNKSLHIYPNPFKNGFTIQYKNTANADVVVTITVFNAQGSRLLYKTQSIKKGVNQITITELEKAAAGAYFIQITNTNTSELNIQKIIKQ
jgi:hypothetical protein